MLDFFLQMPPVSFVVNSRMNLSYFFLCLTVFIIVVPAIIVKGLSSKVYK